MDISAVFFELCTGLKINTPPHDLTEPCFDIRYHARDCGMPTSDKNLENLEYVLIVTLSIENMPDLYNLIRQKYQTLQPIEIQQQVMIMN